MQRLSRILGVLALALLANSSPALAGGADGGGGAQIESAFRLRAYDLISRVGATPTANAVCAASVMQDALDHTRIRVVRQLINPGTHKPITDRDLDAWTVQGDMQLLHSWARYLNDTATPASGQSIDVLILHEVYRATGGLCDDEYFKISQHIPELLKQPTQYSMIMKLSYAESRAGGHDGKDGHWVSWQAWVAFEKADGGGIRAIVYEKQGSVEELTVSGSSISFSSGPLSRRDATRLKNLILATDSAHPLYIVYDMQQASISYGMDLAHLFTL